MLATVDYVGVATLITAVGAVLTSLVVAVRQTTTKEKLNDVHAAVSMSNGGTLGGMVEKIDRATTEIAPLLEEKP